MLWLEEERRDISYHTGLAVEIAPVAQLKVMRVPASYPLEEQIKCTRLYAFLGFERGDKRRQACSPPTAHLQLLIPEHIDP
jgi:hypothetical protein